MWSSETTLKNKPHPVGHHILGTCPDKAVVGGVIRKAIRVGKIKNQFTMKKAFTILVLLALVAVSGVFAQTP